MKQNYAGGCQCGTVRYEVALDLSAPVIARNCSRCGRLGSLLAFAPAADFKLLSGESGLTDYQFNKRVIHHLFCSTCGIGSRAASGPATAPTWSPSMRAASTASSPTRSR